MPSDTLDLPLSQSSSDVGSVVGNPTVFCLTQRFVVTIRSILQVAVCCIALFSHVALCR